MRILLVEDDNFLANGLSLVLKDSGYMVDHAEDGIAADISLSTTHYDLVVLDLCLPGIGKTFVCSDLFKAAFL